MIVPYTSCLADNRAQPLINTKDSNIQSRHEIDSTKQNGFDMLNSDL